MLLNQHLDSLYNTPIERYKLNYQELYDNLIKLAKERTPLTEGYEVHHIVPRCLGGSDDKDNLIKLTYKEHYLAHAYLSLIHPDNDKLIFAFNMMGRVIKDGDIPITPEEYAQLREQYSKAHSNRMIGNKNSSKKRSLEYKLRMSNSLLNSDYNTSGQRGREISQSLIGNKNALGHKQTDTHKLNISQGLKNSEYIISGRSSIAMSERLKGNQYGVGRKKTEEQCKVISERFKGNKHNVGRIQKQTPCPYCNKNATNANLVVHHGPHPRNGDPDSTPCRIKSLELGTSW